MKGKISQILKTSSALLLALVLWECILRSVVELNPGSRQHPVLGKITKPGNYIQSSEGYTRTQINSLGMRAEEISPKASNEYRILVLGDSFSMAEQITDEQVFTALIEAQLNQQISTTTEFQVINAGKLGASPANYLYTADFYQATVQPDSVIIQLTSDDFARQLTDPAEEFYLSNKAGNYHLVYNQSFGSSEPLSRFLLNRFPQFGSLLELSSFRLAGKQLQQFGQVTAPALGATPVAVANDGANIGPSSQQPDEAVIDWTIKQLQESFPTAVLLFVPAIRYDDFENGKPETILDPSEIYNLAIEELVQEKAFKYKVPIINMRQGFSTFYMHHSQHLKGFNNTQPGIGHLNVTGHQLIAIQIMEFYESSNFLRIVFATDAADTNAQDLD